VAFLIVLQALEQALSHWLIGKLSACWSSVYLATPNCCCWTYLCRSVWRFLYSFAVSFECFEVLSLACWWPLAEYSGTEANNAEVLTHRELVPFDRLVIYDHESPSFQRVREATQHTHLQGIDVLDCIISAVPMRIITICATKTE